MRPPTNLQAKNRYRSPATPVRAVQVNTENFRCVDLEIDRTGADRPRTASPQTIKTEAIDAVTQAVPRGNLPGKMRIENRVGNSESPEISGETKEDQCNDRDGYYCVNEDSDLTLKVH